MHLQWRICLPAISLRAQTIHRIGYGRIVRVFITKWNRKNSNQNSIYTGTINFTIYSSHRRLTTWSKQVSATFCGILYVSIITSVQYESSSEESIKMLLKWQWKSIECNTFCRLGWVGLGLGKNRLILFDSEICHFSITTISAAAAAAAVKIVLLYN